MEKAEVLVIEDDADIREGVRILLESEGYFVKEAENGEAGLQDLSEITSLVILDIMMPGMSGLFLTAKAQESDKLLGLMAGGDDYLTKPFSYAELLGRVKAQIRRYMNYRGLPYKQKADEEAEYIRSRGIEIHTRFNEVIVNGKSVELSEIEYHMLLLMMRHKGKIFSAQNLYESIWNEPYFYSCNGTVMVHIRKLRVKIEEDAQNPKYIRTVWGKGYRFGGGYE